MSMVQLHTKVKRRAIKFHGSETCVRFKLRSDLWGGFGKCKNGFLVLRGTEEFNISELK